MKTPSILLAAVLSAGLLLPGAAHAAPLPAQTQLVVESYHVDKPEITPGDAFTLSFTVRNTDAKQAARDIMVTVSAEGGALLPREKTTEYLGKIAPGKTATFTFAFIASRSAAPGVHDATVQVEGEGYRGMPLTARAGLPVEIVTPKPEPPEAPRLRADAPESPSAHPGEPVSVKVAVHNLGRETIRNLTATAGGGSLVVVKDVYGGNLESGQSNELEVLLKFDESVAEAVKGSDAWKNVKPGGPAPVLDYPGELTLAYEDGSGQAHTMLLAFTARASVPRPDEPVYSVPAQQSAGAAAPDITGWVVAGIALVAAACIAFIALWQARRRRSAL